LILVGLGNWKDSWKQDGLGLGDVKKLYGLFHIGVTVEDWGWSGISFKEKYWDREKDDTFGSEMGTLV